MTGRKIPVDTHPTKDVVVSSLTRDASVQACVFDLIDNSIDAARDALEAAGTLSSDEHGLPLSYEGLKIELSIDDSGIKISDSCGGISSSELSTMVLRFGIRSNRKYGIGLYGVGLNRAIFKLGNYTRFETDDGKEMSVLDFEASEYLGSDDWELPATVYPSKGKKGTSIEISDPPKNVARFISDKSWVDDFGKEAGKRYFKFLTKGLKIKINKEDVSPVFVPLREDGPFPSLRKYYRADDGVTVYIEAGQHHLHRFSAEPDFDRKTNNQLTDEYGWSVICNDRLIVMCDTSEKTGWDKKWHPEFNGFVGYVWFVAEDGTHLPWNTPKTDVDTLSVVYQEAIEDMRRFTERWRSYGRDAKAARKRGDTLLPPQHKPRQSDKPGKKPSSEKSRKPEQTESKTEGPVKKEPISKIDHNSLRTVLPPDVDERYCKDKLLSLVHEAKRIDIYDNTYSGLALIRMLFETAVVEYMIRTKRAAKMRDFCIERKEKDKGKKLSAALKKSYQPSINELCEFILNNDGVWGEHKSAYIKGSAEKFKKHKEKLNSAIHNPLQPINFLTALAIRDEVLPVLRHFIED